MALAELSSGCFETIMSGGEYTDPILQVLGTKRISGGANVERYRLLLSDGQYLQSYSMLSTELNHLVTEGALSEFTIIRVKRYVTSVVNVFDEDKSRRVLIIAMLEVVKTGEEVGKKIGDPIDWANGN